MISCTDVLDEVVAMFRQRVELSESDHLYQRRDESSPVDKLIQRLRPPRAKLWECGRTGAAATAEN